jgi:hypothetical protein
MLAVGELVRCTDDGWISRTALQADERDLPEPAEQTPGNLITGLACRFVDVLAAGDVAAVDDLYVPPRCTCSTQTSGIWHSLVTGDAQNDAF